eukprot:TRINITY_DN355_c0_g8_i1.p1 TRINITY_DN355_c0_g8~~TRINITY_DN355_c0_g8_i1.p1  ORF type:complete len:218 (-),score=96.58 TRINITY_DN355_c0_g8_i1:84-689(-)
MSNDKSFLSIEQMATIESSWHRVCSIRGLNGNCLDTFDQVFYHKLFELEPRTRALFEVDIFEQGVKLMKVLAYLTTTARKLTSNNIEEVKKLGARHKVYGVEPSFFEAFKEALLWTLERFLTIQDSWNEEIRQSWTFVLDLLCSTMIKAAKSNSLVRQQKKKLKLLEQQNHPNADIDHNNSSDEENESEEDKSHFKLCSLM